ncbi:NigD-like C-terminal domain-containing protein [Bacteroides sp. 224]|uniref:NigD1/NigD2 family lipoprotein n=1 Tax=Bacteroides sp. 224 TaxID=2302936 RepID=UPI0013D012C8|nr:NigD-like C-terminal domain-containing protein [Bacteroides sp. 224]NDV66754.1 hypothetical protein [Bacteroides sp. 224]
MKQIKFLVLAFTILLGTTFTSCLDSDDSPATYYAFATVNNNMLGYITLTTDDGLTLTPANPTDMKYSNGDYPDRVYIAYNLVEGQEMQQGITKYDIKFLGYMNEVAAPDYSSEPVESKTYIYQLAEEGWAANNYLNIAVSIKYGEDTNTKTDFALYPDKVEDNVLYFRLVHKEEVAKANGTYSYYMSFFLPTKSSLQSKFEELEFSGDNNDEIQVVITAEEGEDTIIKTNPFKIRLLR